MEGTLKTQYKKRDKKRIKKNWAIGIDMYTLMFIKLMTDKDLQYKQTKQNKTNKQKVGGGWPNSWKSPPILKRAGILLPLISL